VWQAREEAELGALRYELVPGWEQLPAGWKHLDWPESRWTRRIACISSRGWTRGCWYTSGTAGSAGVGGDRRLHRSDALPALRTDGCLYTVDDGDHTVRKFDPAGRLLMTLGTPGVPRTPATTSSSGRDTYQGTASIRRAAAVQQADGVAIARAGPLRLRRVRECARPRFSPEGSSATPGRAGTAPGSSTCRTASSPPDGRVLVADRENERIQLFTPRDLPGGVDGRAAPHDVVVDAADMST